MLGSLEVLRPIVQGHDGVVTPLCCNPLRRFLFQPLNDGHYLFGIKKMLFRK